MKSAKLKKFSITRLAWLSLALIAMLSGRDLQAAPDDTRELLEVFAPLVSQKGWSRNTSPYGLGDLDSDIAVLPVAKRTTLRDGFVRGSALRARSHGKGMRLTIIAVRFNDNSLANSFVETGRNVLTSRRVEPEHVASTLVEGVHATTPTGSLWFVVRNTRVLVLIVRGAPVFTPETQLAWLEYALNPDRDSALAPAVPQLDHAMRKIRVRVVDPQGQPVHEGLVTSRGFPATPLVDGHCMIEVENDVYLDVLDAEDEAGRRLARQGIARVRANATDVTIKTRYVVHVEGQVLGLNGAPKPNVTVHLYQEFFEWLPIDSAKTDANGMFSIALESDRHESWLLWLVGDQGPLLSDTPRVATGSTSTIRVVPSEPAIVDVVGPDGTPVVGARVIVPERPKVYRDRGRGRIVVGAVAANAPTKAIVAAPSTMPMVAPVAIELVGGKTITARLPKAWTLRGTVSGATSKVGLQVDDGVSPIFWRTTNDEGSFELFHLPNGPVRVGITERKRPLSVLRWHAFSRHASPVVLGDPRGATLTVRARTVDRQPIDDISVTLRQRGRSHAFKAERGVATFKSFDVGGGQLTIHDARGRDGKPLNLAPVALDLELGQADVDVTLSPGRAVSGSVTADGKPVAGVEILASLEDRELFSERTHARTHTQPDGSFKLIGLTAHEYTLRTRPPAPFAAPSDYTLRPEEKRIALRLPRGVQIVVVDPNEMPVQHATITVSADGARYRAKTGGLGLAWVASIPNSRLSVRAPRVRGLARQGIDPWDGKARQIKLRTSRQPLLTMIGPPPGRRVEIRVSAARKGDAGWIRRAGPGVSPAIHKRVTFNDQGRATVADLLSGTYTLWIPTLRADPGCVYDEYLTLNASVLVPTTRTRRTLRFSLKGPADMATPTVEVFDPMGAPVTVRTTPEGYTTDALPHGTWRVTVRAKTPTGWVGADERIKTSKTSVSIQLLAITDKQ